MANLQGRRERGLVYLCWVLVALNAIYFGKLGMDYLLRRDDVRRQQTFEAALETIESEYVSDVNREKLFDAAMRGMIRGLNDPWSAYLTPRQATRDQELTEGRFVGIGVVIMGREIVEVFEDGPADEAGLLVGDVITEVDGQDIVGETTESMVDLIRGERGTEVEVTVQRQGLSSPVQVSVRRDTVEIPNVKYEVLDEGVGWLELNGFDRDMPGEVRTALQEMQAGGIKGLIIDVRRNLGGLVQSTVRVSDMFLDGGTIYRLESDKELSPKDRAPVTAEPGTVLPPGVSIVVLTSSGTASAAEILAGSLQAHDRAVIIGSRTMGKGSVNAKYTLPDRSAIYITVAHYVLANGRVVEKQGLEPDIEFSYTLPEPDQQTQDDPAALRRWMRDQRKAADEAIRRRALDYLLNSPEDTDTED
jgi:carboxyl-terminal processing protease